MHKRDEMRTVPQQDEAQVLAEVHVCILKIKKKITRLNKKMKKHNNVNNYKDFYIVEGSHAEEKAINR